MKPYAVILVFLICVSCASVQKPFQTAFYKLPTVSTLQMKDMDAVKNHIGNRKVVMLGESIHMTSEFSTVRKHIIHNLHEQSDFQLLLFEGSPIEFWIAQDKYLNSKRNQSAVDEFQKTALFGLWQTLEINAVLKDVLQTQATNRPMYVSSYDVQIGQGRNFAQGKSVLGEFVKILNTRKVKLKRSEEKELLFLENLVSCKRKKFPVAAEDFRKAEESIKRMDQVISRMKTASTLESHELFLKSMPVFMKFSLDFCNEANSSKRNYTEVRDDWASKQFLSQIHTIGKKSIVWAHSGHVRLGPSKSGRMSFGSFTRKSLGQDIFGIHFTARTGTAIAFMDSIGNEIEPIEKSVLSVDSVSLEKMLSGLESQSDIFVPVFGNEQFFSSPETTRSEPDGFGPINPLLDFDGYYLIQEIKPPKLDL